jgi:hypothetical protein
VARIPTGAWFDPDWETQTCVHGNPNAVTLDRGTSRLGQGSIGQLCLVQVEKFTDDLPPVRCHEPPGLGAWQAIADPTAQASLGIRKRGVTKEQATSTAPATHDPI